MTPETQLVVHPKNQECSTSTNFDVSIPVDILKPQSSQLTKDPDFQKEWSPREKDNKDLALACGEFIDTAAWWMSINPGSLVRGYTKSGLPVVAMNDPKFVRIPLDVGNYDSERCQRRLEKMKVKFEPIANEIGYQQFAVVNGYTQGRGHIGQAFLVDLNRRRHTFEMMHVYLTESHDYPPTCIAESVHRKQLTPRHIHRDYQVQRISESLAPGVIR